MLRKFISLTLFCITSVILRGASIIVAPTHCYTYAGTVHLRMTAFIITADNASAKYLAEMTPMPLRFKGEVHIPISPEQYQQLIKGLEVSFSGVATGATPHDIKGTLFPEKPNYGHVTMDVVISPRITLHFFSHYRYFP